MTTQLPDGYGTISPYLIVEDACALSLFLKDAVAATETRRAALPSGEVMNIEMAVGTSMVILVQARSDQLTSSTAFYVYVGDVDQTYARALAAGGVSIMEPADQFYGDRGAGFRDLAGNDWWLATRLEDLTSEQLASRIAAADFKRH